MSRLLATLFITSLFLLFSSSPVFAQSTNPDILNFTKDTLQIITLIATALAVFFLVFAGYTYITSAGKPEALESAKKTIKNALIGLTLVLAANVVTSVFQHALNSQTSLGNGSAVDVMSIQTVEPSDGLTQVLIDAVAGFIQNIVESSTAPIVNGVLGYLTTTPTLLGNEVIRNFWFITVGIVDALFILVVALMGLQVMSASTFGFEEVEIKHLLPKLGLTFLLANISLFLADYAVITCNTLVKVILDSTGGINHTWIENAFNPTTVITGTTPLIIFIFMVLFLIVSIVLLLMYISRLIFISLGAVLSPFIFLLSALPKFSDFAFIAMKTYLVSVFIVFVHVVIIQLASAFLTLPEHSENSLISIAIGIGLFITLLKTPNLMMQMVMYTSNSGSMRKLGNQIINVMTTDNASTGSRISAKNAAVKVTEKAIKV